MEMLAVIGIVLVAGVFIAYMAIREQRLKELDKPVDPMDQIFDRLDSSIDSLSEAFADASMEDLAELDVGEITATRARLTERQLQMLSDAHSYGQLVTHTSEEGDGTVVAGQGDMRTVYSLVRRGLLQEERQHHIRADQPQ